MVPTDAELQNQVSFLFNIECCWSNKLNIEIRKWNKNK